MKVLFASLVSLMSFFVSHAQINFLPMQTFASGSPTKCIAIGDLNNDDLNDVAVVNGFSYGSVFNYKLVLYYQQTNGELGSPKFLNYPSYDWVGVENIGISDVNNDSLNEIVISCMDSIMIFHHNLEKSGIIDSTTTYFSGDNIDAMKIEDVNNDNLDDIILTHWQSAHIRIFYQENTGKLRYLDYPALKTTNADLEIADINNDHLKDIIFIGAFDNSQQEINVMKQTAPEEFTSPVGYPLDEISINGLEVQDINNDQLPDVLLTKSANTPTYIIIYYNNGTPNFFNNPVYLPAFEIPKPISVADLNCDGSVEIITAHAGWHTLSVYDKRTNSAYDKYQSFRNAYGSYTSPNNAMAIGDLNNDAASDIALAAGSDSWVLFYNDSKPYVSDSVNVKIPNQTQQFVFSRVGVNQNIIYSDAAFQVSRVDSFQITDTNITIIGYDYHLHIREGEICGGYYQDSVKADSVYYWTDILDSDSVLISSTLDTTYFTKASSLYNNEWIAFPNPACGRISVQLPDKVSTMYYDLYIINSLGMPVYYKKRASGTVQIDIPEKGLFLIKIIQGNQVLIKQIINQ